MANYSRKEATMREILYRAISLCRGEGWVYGQPRHYALEPRREKWTIFDPYTGIETDINEKTLGQYTNLTDKNGSKIFEGDIIALNPRRFANKKVFYYSRCAGFYMTSNPDIPKTYEITAIFNDNSDKYEVIGNIHDNPELIKSDEVGINRQKDEDRIDRR